MRLVDCCAILLGSFALEERLLMPVVRPAGDLSHAVTESTLSWHTIVYDNRGKRASVIAMDCSKKSFRKNCISVAISPRACPTY